MTHIQIASAVCLGLVAALTATAIFSRNYHENWLQFAGLVGLCVWASARVAQLVDATDARLPMQGLTMHASLALYAVGTALKVWQHRTRSTGGPPPAPPETLPMEHMPHAAGGTQEPRA